jgi:hypothetical protein
MKSLLISCFFLLSAIALKAQSTTSTVYFIRERAYEGSLAAYFAYMDDEMLCKINNKKFSIHEVPSGAHVFGVQYSGGKPNNKTEGKVSITLEPGKTYYFKVNPVTRAFGGYLGLVEVTENTFNTLKPGLTQDTECK